MGPPGTLKLVKWTIECVRSWRKINKEGTITI